MKKIKRKVYVKDVTIAVTIGEYVRETGVGTKDWLQICMSEISEKSTYRRCICH